MRRVLGLFAHPDDEVFCAGGTLARLTDGGAQARVVSFTRGEAGRIHHVQLARRSTLGAVRTQELVEAGAVLGVTDTKCLDFADGTLANQPRSELVEAAAAEILDFGPDTVVSFDETGAYGHPDHVTMSHVSKAACELVACTTPERAPDRLLHAAFPQRDQLLLEMIVDWLSSLPERFRGSESFTNALLMFADSSSMLGFAADRLRTEWFPAGSFIVEQNEPAESLYLLLSGTVDVKHESNGTLRQVASVGVGEFIGEVGLATGQTRNAHCIAKTDCACFVLAPHAETAWKPRGGTSEPLVGPPTPVTNEASSGLVVDVSSLVDRKFRALTKHRTQYPIEPDLFPASMLDELLGRETFIEAWSAPGADSKTEVLFDA